jgi:SAM-dependent methyltransferase
MTDQRTGVADHVSALFDAKAGSWSEKYRPGGPLTGRLRDIGDAVRREVSQGQAVLDLGCGTGELALRLSCCGYRVTGCDISPGMLTEAGLHDYGRAVRWRALEPGWQRLPFADASFDGVVLSSVLEYTDDPVAVLAECARVLRPGGTVHCPGPDLRHPVRWAELPAWAAARALAPADPGGTARVGRYASYLRLSQQRHRERWWRAAASRAGLDWADAQTEAEGRSPLRRLLLRRPDGGRQS